MCLINVFKCLLLLVDNTQGMVDRMGTYLNQHLKNFFRGNPIQFKCYFVLSGEKAVIADQC